MLFFLAALLLPSVPVSAQEQALTVQVAGLTADEWPQVQAVVTVLGGDSHPVADLTEASFQARLNDSPVPVIAATQGVDNSLPIAVVLALDVSGSMEGGGLEQAKVAARRFLEGLGPQDSVAVLTFGDTVDVVQPFTLDWAAAADAIDGLSIGGATALYQATAESVRVAAASDTSRRAVVLLSDGLDHGSALSSADALTTVETLGVPVFAIGLGTDIDLDYLEALARISGGQFAETPSPAGLAQLYQDAGELLRGQYILTLDASGLALAESEAATLRVDASVNERAGSDERAVCPQTICVTLSEVADGERLGQERTFVAQVLSEDPVASVTFLVDGEPVLTLTDPPYRFAFDAASVSDGDHTVAAKVATSAGQTAAREVGVRAGAGGGGFATGYLAIAAVLVAAVGGALLFLYLRRGRGEEEPGASAPPEPPPKISATGSERRPLWEEESPPLAQAPQEPLGRLCATGGPLAGQTFPLGDAPASIGSGQSCLIRLSEQVEDDPEIAAEHVRVWIRGGKLMMHELRRLTEVGAVGGRWQFLSPGDVFTVGPCTFRFELDAEGGAGEDESSRGVPNILRSSADRSDKDVQESASSAPEDSEREEPDAPPAAESGDPESTLLQFPGPSRRQPDE